MHPFNADKTFDSLIVASNHVVESASLYEAVIFWRVCNMDTYEYDF